ncbi:hypothetical protein MHU86_20939 [Fragilaria crotonensis]|nr:hypothetical protein MHU86_20939 [Fragilaria crotonensis]
MSSASVHYLPTSDDMQKAMVVALSNTNGTPTTKEVQTILETDNPAWKLPERRVRKFLNRELKKQGKPVPESCPEDDEESVIDSSPSSRAREIANSTGRALKKVLPFSFRKKKQEKQAGFANEASLTPTITSSPTLEEKVVERPAEIVETDTHFKPEAGVEETDDHQDKEISVYVDDNDGKKEGMVCAECTIL